MTIVVISCVIFAWLSKLKLFTLEQKHFLFDVTSVSKALIGYNNYYGCGLFSIFGFIIIFKRTATCFDKKITDHWGRYLPGQMYLNNFFF